MEVDQAACAAGSPETGGRPEGRFIHKARRRHGLFQNPNIVSPSKEVEEAAACLLCDVLRGRPEPGRAAAAAGEAPSPHRTDGRADGLRISAPGRWALRPKRQRACLALRREPEPRVWSARAARAIRHGTFGIAGRATGGAAEAPFGHRGQSSARGRAHGGTGTAGGPVVVRCRRLLAAHRPACLSNAPGAAGALGDMHIGKKPAAVEANPPLRTRGRPGAGRWGTVCLAEDARGPASPPARRGRRGRENRSSRERKRAAGAGPGVSG